MKRGKSNRGFTLVELMVVITIAGLALGSVAPLYQSFVERAQEAQASDLLARCAFQLEQYANLHFSYEGADAAFAERTLCDPASAEFELSLEIASRDRFILTALPADVVAGNEQYVHEEVRYYWFDNTSGFGFKLLSEAPAPLKSVGSRLVVSS